MRNSCSKCIMRLVEQHSPSLPLLDTWAVWTPAGGGGGHNSYFGLRSWKSENAERRRRRRRRVSLVSPKLSSSVCSYSSYRLFCLVVNVIWRLVGLSDRQCYLGTIWIFSRKVKAKLNSFINKTRMCWQLATPGHFSQIALAKCLKARRGRDTVRSALDFLSAWNCVCPRQTPEWVRSRASHFIPIGLAEFYIAVGLKTPGEGKSKRLF
jgi:hypothetical protein